MFYLLFILLLLAGSSVFAEDLTEVTVNTVPIFTLALIVITAIAAIWIIKKLIKLGNRS